MAILPKVENNGSKITTVSEKKYIMLSNTHTAKWVQRGNCTLRVGDVFPEGRRRQMGPQKGNAQIVLHTKPKWMPNALHTWKWGQLLPTEVQLTWYKTPLTPNTRMEGKEELIYIESK
jgi:hypothetical protein